MHFNRRPPEELQHWTRGTKLIIVGDSPNKEKDFYAVDEAMPGARVMSLNNSAFGGWIVPDFVVTMHCAVNNFLGSHRMPLEWIPDTAIVYGYECNGDQHPRTDELFNADPIWGTCALPATLVGLSLGFERIVLVGCDMEGAYGSPSKLDAWRPWVPYFDGRVKSWRGNLIDILNG